ncbi:MAG: filamentous hemagglutinin N-terminal domain-containing protein [Verrucomicrobiales bacterium]|nr:filamentous hemagglutinin N-terminal domain-containing protein [Verrucomicrobiales bacterium]
MRQSLMDLKWVSWYLWMRAWLFVGLLMISMELRANPSGGVVTAGVAEILSDVNNPAVLQIIQGSNKAIINWQDFSISAGEHTQFVQPSQMAAVLNRVISGNPSVIAGMLSANGKVIVVNQNGIIVTSSGVVDAAGGVVLSTLDIADGDFMNGMDDSFLGITAAGVTNYGTIMSAGGDVILLGNFIDNAGIIGAPDGVVALGAGGNIVVNVQGENKISIKAPGVGAQTGVNNSGSITGAAAELKAHGNVYALAINNSGMIRATGSQIINGRVMLTSRSADGATGGNIENTGEIKANNVDGSGGFIMIDGGSGSNVGILDGKILTNGIGNTAGGGVVIIGQTINIAQGAEVAANGMQGGTILIGSAEDTRSVTIGGKVSANGSSGNGGAVMVVGDSTSVLSVTSSGRITAMGGQNGGLVSMQGGSINATLGSVIDAGGAINGGSVAIIGEAANGAVNLNGTINAAGGTGAGGVITATGAGNVNIGVNAVMNADGATGGLVSIDGAATTNMAGTVSALGNNGKGGTANVTGQNVVVAVQVSMDVSGLTGGGQINVGGGFQGKDESLRNSDSTVVGGLATLKADAVNSGDAGGVVIWSDGDTIFGGEISARAIGEVGRGGFVEVSGKQRLRYNGMINASSVSGDRGTVLFDPGDITVGGVGSSLPISGVNAILDTNVNVTIATESGDIVFESLTGDFRDVSVQWNTDADLGVFASGDVRFLNSVRSAGAGSLNVIAGWTGVGADPQILSGNPELAWVNFVRGAELGSFGEGGSVYINDATNDRAVEVGSRYGNTNVAALHVLLTGAVGGAGRWAQLGFRDNGQVFWVKEDIHRIDGPGVQVGKPLVGMVGVNEAYVGGEFGVRMFNDLSATGDDLLGDGGGVTHFLRYADDFSSPDDGNWWWRRLDGTAGGSSGIGDNLPEMGAGISDELFDSGAARGLSLTGAEINIEAKGALILRAGNAGDSYNSNYAQVGHGGNSRDWQNINLTRATNGERDAYSSNWGSGNSFTTAMGRLAPIYGDINIRTGLVLDSVSGGLQASRAAGVVWVQAVDAGNTTGRLNNAYAQIGHLGTGQGGSVDGAINILAGGMVRVESGFGRRSSAVIGHAIDDTGDLRRGKGLLGTTGVTPDGKFGGGQYKQFRVFALNAEQTSAGLGRGDLAGYRIPNLGVGGIYDGNTEVTGAGADVFTHLQGDIIVDSVTGDVLVLGKVGAADVPRERITNSPARIGHGALGSDGEYRLNVMGDIEVKAARDIFVIAGNGRMSSAQIGFYGGARDDTNDYTVGNISVEAGRDLVIEGGGRVPLFPRNSGGTSTDYQAFAMIGHGGNEADSKFKNGDISVRVGGDLTMTSGAYGGAFVQIGHGGEDSEGQVGGSYTRTIMIAAAGSNGERNVNWVTSNVGAADVQLDANMTANITVSVDGDMMMDHLPTNNPLVENTQRLDDPNTPLDESDPTRMRMDGAYTLIGHGGSNTTESTTNELRRYWNKTGDVTVNTLGSLTMFNGGGNNNWYTRIGLGATNGDSQSNGREAYFSGDVIVNVGMDLIMNANWAPTEYMGIPIPPGGNGGYKDFVAANPVAIGNGGTRDGRRIFFDGNVTVFVGGDAALTSGKGVEASYAQIGNGGAGSLSQNAGVDDNGKFSGDVTVRVIGSLTMKANPDGVAYIIDPTNFNNFGLEVRNSYVLIGNGGAYWETQSNDVATMEGNVTVVVGRDLKMRAGFRDTGGMAPPMQDGDGNWAVLINSFVQIGHSNSGTGSYSDGTTGIMSGDIDVQVGNDLTMTGGQGELDSVESGNVGAYAQIGSGGAEMDGNISGDIEIRVGNSLTTVDGAGANNSYVKIGNGDWLRDEPMRSGAGERRGDINIYVGDTASFDRTLVGHRDSATSTGEGVGDVFIGVSRNKPFYDPGTPPKLIAINGTVFSSGTDIILGELRFYMPSRSANGMAEGTMLNGFSFTGADVDFQAPVVAGRSMRGSMASFQRDDEIYLQPDWWADANGDGGDPFPVGSVAEVSDPGGFANLANAPAGGNLGDGTGVNPHGEDAYLGLGINVSSDVLNYTLYYDAIENVAPLAPVVPGAGGGAIVGGGFAPPIVPPVVIPPFVPDVELFSFLFFNQSGADLFGYTERDYLIIGDVVDGGGDTVEGQEAQQPHWLFGVADRVLTPEEDARERRRRARYRPQVNNGGRTFYVYDVSSREYSSFRLFGAPSSPRP